MNSQQHFKALFYQILDDLCFVTIRAPSGTHDPHSFIGTYTWLDALLCLYIINNFLR